MTPRRETGSTFSRQRPPRAVRAVNLAGKLARRVRRDWPSLQPADVMAAAAKATGLEDFGSDEFREPLAVLLGALEREANLSFVGRYFARGQAQSALANRLLMQRDWTAHPEILRQEIRAPFYVLGLPRTGSTILQNLLALDTANRSLLGWEAATPSPPPERATYESDPRITAAERTTRLLDYLAPDARALHPVAPRLPTECVTLFLNSFASLETTTINHVPSYLEWCLAADYRPHYAYYKRQLQQLQWHCAGERWLLKSPAHLFFVDVLLETFPDACIVQTHRDPLRAVASYCSLAAVLHGIGSASVDPRAIGAIWPKAWAEGLARAAAARDHVDPRRVFDCHYDELVADPVAMVRSIYAHFGYEYRDEFDGAMRAFLAENPQHKGGVHRYSLEQFGCDPRVERERFAPYRERFGVRDESGV